DHPLQLLHIKRLDRSIPLLQELFQRFPIHARPSVCRLASWHGSEALSASDPRRPWNSGSKGESRMPPMRITLTIIEGSLKGEEYVFHDVARCVVGRSPDCDIALPMNLLHRDISRHHCVFEIDPPTVRVRDLDSLNGTHVNGEKIGQRPNLLARGESGHERGVRELRDGDEVRLGDTAIRVSVDVLGLLPMSSGYADLWRRV